MTNSTTAVRIANATRAYTVNNEQVLALRGINMTITRGSFTAFMGRSGSGKTTLLRNLLVQHLAAGHGIGLIDPHGDLADDLLRYLAEARERTGLPTITEVMEPNQVDIVAEYSDILQIGTRNMQNYSLLRDVGRVQRPVMLKRGYGATIEEWLMAAEYIISSGNPNVILCERGIRTFETYTRNTFDVAAVPLLHQLTHLPVIVDPSHATGKRWLVTPLAVSGVAVGADARGRQEVASRARLRRWATNPMITLTK